MINRSAIALRPKQPFLDWLTSVEQSNEELVPEGLEKTIYLVPEYDEPDDAVKMLAEAREGIFHQELFTWYTTVRLWPRDRSLEVFKECFDYEHFDTQTGATYKPAFICLYPVGSALSKSPPSPGLAPVQVQAQARRTPASAIRAHAAASEPFVSIPRQPASTTVT
jgi:hypothetical protein